MAPREYYVYVATNRRGTLYTGFTNNIERRMWEHRTGQSEFTSKYRIGKLLFVETFASVQDARESEKRIKGWTRARKLALIRTQNPAFRDLLPQTTWDTAP